MSENRTTLFLELLTARVTAFLRRVVGPTVAGQRPQPGDTRRLHRLSGGLNVASVVGELVHERRC